MGINMFACERINCDGKIFLNPVDSNQKLFQNNLYHEEFGIRLNQNIRYILHTILNIDFKDGFFTIEVDEIEGLIEKLKLSIMNLENLENLNVVDDILIYKLLIDFFIFCRDNKYVISAG